MTNDTHPERSLATPKAEGEHSFKYGRTGYSCETCGAIWAETNGKNSNGPCIPIAAAERAEQLAENIKVAIAQGGLDGAPQDAVTVAKSVSRDLAELVALATSPQAAEAVPAGHVRIDSGEVHFIPKVRDADASPFRDGDSLYATPPPAPPLPEGEAPLPFWEPCNPGCDPEFNGYRSRFCATLCHNAREALAAPLPADSAQEGEK